MTYNANIHRPQMAARAIDECLLKAMGADEGHDRDYHVKDALEKADALFDLLVTLRRELAGLAQIHEAA